MGSTQSQKVLAGTALFGSLPPAALEAIAAQGIERNYRKGQVLFSAGDPGESLYVLLEGAVKGYATSEDGAELILGIIEPPAVFGEVALGDGGVRTASIEVVAQSRVLVISRPQFFAALGEHPRLVESYITGLVAMIRNLQDRTESFVFLDLQGRVAKLIVKLLAERSPDGVTLDLNMTQGELAAMVGGSRPSVNQVLKALEGRGYIALEGRQIRVKDAERLNRLSSS